MLLQFPLHHRFPLLLSRRLRHCRSSQSQEQPQPSRHEQQLSKPSMGPKKSEFRTLKISHENSKQQVSVQPSNSRPHEANAATAAKRKAKKKAAGDSQRHIGHCHQGSISCKVCCALSAAQKKSFFTEQCPAIPASHPVHGSHAKRASHWLPRRQGSERCSSSPGSSRASPPLTHSTSQES